MALQKKTVSTAQNGYGIALTLTELNVDRKTNISSVSYKFTISNTEGKRFLAEGYSWNISIAGQTIPIVDYKFNLSKSDPTRNIATGRLTVQHDLDGSCAMPYSVSVPGIENGPPAMELKGTWELTPIPRIPAVFCPGGFIAETVPIRIDALDENLSYTLSYSFGAMRGTIAEGVSASEISWTIPESFYTQIPEAKEGICLLVCKAYSGDKEIGSGYCEFAAKVDPAVNAPTISVDIADSNAGTVALTGDAGVLVRYCSDARVTTLCEGKNSAYVSKYTVNRIGTEYSRPTMDFFNVETGEFRIEAIDSRGFSATQTVKKELIPYIKLTCDLSDNKPDGDGNMTVKVSGNYFNGSFGAQRNSLQVAYRYKVAGGTYGDWIPMEANIAVRSYTAQAKLSGLAYQTAYVFQARATDKLWLADSAEYTVRAMPVFDWDENDFNVNGSLKINNETVADFVVSRGKTSIWNWEKWNSGIVKCWGISGEKNYTFLGEDPVCQGQTIHTYNYPFALTEVLSVNADIIAEGYVVPVILSTEQSLRVSAVRLCGGDDSVAGRYSFQVLGRWK